MAWPYTSSPYVVADTSGTGLDQPSAGAALFAYDPVGGIPDPNAKGPEYRRWIGPEMTLLSTPASTRSLTLGGQRAAGAGRTFRIRLASATLDKGSPASVLPLLPTGRRQSWNISLGVTLR